MITHLTLQKSDNAAKIAFQYLAKSEYSNFAVQIQVLENATSTQL